MERRVPAAHIGGGGPIRGRDPDDVFCVTVAAAAAIQTAVAAIRRNNRNYDLEKRRRKRSGEGIDGDTCVGLRVAARGSTDMRMGGWGQGDFRRLIFIDFFTPVISGPTGGLPPRPRGAIAKKIGWFAVPGRNS